MKTRVYILPVLLVLMALAACSKSTTEPETLTIEDLLVKNNELAGWVYGDTRWVARNYSELYIPINGAAVIYERHGFREAASQNYMGTIDDVQVEITIMVFDQTTAENAENLFNDPDTDFGGATPWPDGAGEEAHYDAAPLSHRMSFYRGKYYVDLNIGSGSEEGLNVLKQFALNIDGKILDNE